MPLSRMSEQKKGGQEETQKAFLGITKPNHPNFFMLFGPGTLQTSIVFMIECQVEYVIGGITKMLTSGAKSLSVKSSVLQNYKEFVRGNDERSKFAQGNC